MQSSIFFSVVQIMLRGIPCVRFITGRFLWSLKVKKYINEIIKHPDHEGITGVGATGLLIHVQPQKKKHVPSAVKSKFLCLP